MLSPALAATLGPMRAPFLLLVPVVTGLGWAAAAYDGVATAPLYLVLASLGALAAHVSVNALNEYEDFRSGLDLITRRTPFSGGSGTLPAHPERAHYALAVGIVGLLIVVAIGAWLIRERGPGLLPLGLLGILLIVSYTRWLTRSPALCLLAPGIAFGPLMVLGTYFALTGRYAWTPAVASLLPLFLVSNLLLMNQFPDQDADRQAGRHHLLLAAGPAVGVRVYGAFLAAAFTMLPAAVIAGTLPPATLLALLTTPLAVRIYRGLARHHADVESLLPFMGQNVLLTLLTPLLLIGGR